MSPDKNPKIASTWSSDGKPKRGRPKETWRRTVDKEKTAQLGTWREEETAARNRATWRRKIDSPILKILR